LRFRSQLEAYETEIPVGSHQTIPGTKHMTGRIKPVCFFGQNGVVLQMQDGRKMKFFFTDMTGTIGFSGWVE
jgi:hypothetical protein